MKRTLFASAVLVSALSGVVSAQGSMIQIGVEAGAAIAKTVGEDDVGLDSRKAPYLGATLIVQKPGAVVGFQTGLMYTPKGMAFEDSESKATFALNYVEVPLLLRISPFKSAKVIPSFVVGATAGLKVSCNIKVELEGVTAKSDCDDVDEGLQVKSFDFGLSGGAEVAIPIGTRMMLAPTLRYTRGMINIPDTDDATDKAKNTAFQFGVGFRIRM
jgi:opacity protein-like surface antigen